MQLIHNTTMGNQQQDSIPIQNKQPIQVKVVSVSRKHTQTNIDLLKVTKFCSRNNPKTFKLQPCHKFKFLNKNLNFIPTSKRFIKDQLFLNPQSFFRIIKLQVHFKNETCITRVNQPREQ